MTSSCTEYSPVPLEFSQYNGTIRWPFDSRVASLRRVKKIGLFCVPWCPNFPYWPLSVVNNTPSGVNSVCNTSLKLNILRPRQNGRHFPDEIFKCIFLDENVWISIKVSLTFVPKGPIDNIPALVQIMAWRRSVFIKTSDTILLTLTLIEHGLQITDYHKVRDEITLAFPNFSGAAVEVWEWISKFIRKWNGHVFTNACWY